MDGGNGRPGSNSGSGISDVRKMGIRDIRKVGRRALRLYDSLIKVFDVAFYLSNHIFFCLQILQYFGNHLENPS